MATNVEAVSNIESARRGSRRCLFNGSSQRVETPVYDWDRLAPGHRLSGPALIDDKTTTVLVVPGFTCEVDPYCNLVLRAQQGAAVDDHSVSENLKQAIQRELA
jgi:N-methylhydantoinase A/oxoprolinase/acetone carboxylase beta subunit